ncbi:hypothetical protein ACWGH2_42620 [Streptomyces sp. NPDC054871]
MLATALRLRDEELSLREIASRLVIRTGKKRGQHPAPATVMRMLREHDEQKAAAAQGAWAARRGHGERGLAPALEQDGCRRFRLSGELEEGRGLNDLLMPVGGTGVGKASSVSVTGRSSPEMLR